MRSSRGRWYLLASLWVLLIVLGFGGFRQQARDSGEPQSSLETLYLLVQLAALEFDASSDFLNWRLQVARFVAPAMAATTVLQTASLVFVDQFRRFRLRFVRNHTVVCGLGEIGTRLAIAFADAGERVVAIASERDADGAGTVGDHDVTVLTGDQTDRALLAAARVQTASRLVAVTGDDATNVSIALHAVDVVGDRRTNALRCAVHLADTELTSLLRAADLDAHRGMRISFFTTHERGARAWLAEHPPLLDDDDPVHVAVFSLGQLGRSLVVNIAQQWLQYRPGERLRITMVDPSASGRWQALTLQHPALAQCCEATVIDFDFDKPTAASVAALQELFADDLAPTWIAYVDESTSLSTAFFITRSLGVDRTPLVVRTRTAGGLGALLIPGTTANDPFPSMHAFPFLDRTCTPESVDGGAREQLAEAVHEDYVRQAGGRSAAADDALLRPWSELTEAQRELSRRRVDGIIADLAAVGHVLAPLRRWEDVAQPLSDAQIETLAERDHQRWFDDRVAAGWSYGEVRDNALKHNPLLVAWRELPHDAQAANRATAAGLGAMLARAGFEALPR
ncbi:MAG TPA: RyR domain-containing protein [Ilumatobacteraceae bacterium]|nr:RyR domain-containing protein [Ilumatobacteraceae bacterium]